MNKRHPGKQKKTDYGLCKMEGCTNTTENGAFGFCRTHYMACRRGQIDRNGQFLYEPKRVRSYGVGARCLVPECGNRPKGLGLCATHYQQRSNGIDLGIEIPNGGYSKEQPSYEGVSCVVNGCLKRPINKGMCSRHTEQRRAGIIDQQGIPLRELMPNGRKRERENWVGSTRDGYILRTAPDGHPHARADGTILEHRLVMENQLGRCLEEWEIVHHKDGNRANNDIHNLELVDGRAGIGTRHHPGHDFDLLTAAQVIAQNKDTLPTAILETLKGILNKGTN